MTIASSSTAELTVNEIVLNAFRLASMQPLEQGPSGVQWERRATAARSFLETIIKSVETEGRLVKARRFYLLELTAGVASYELPEAIMDVYGDASYIPAGEDPAAPASEMVIRQQTMEEWQLLGGRDGQGTPSLYFADRSGAAITVQLWQIPEEAGTIRFQTYYLLANVSDGNATPELERYWAEYLTYRLASYVAEAGDQDRSKIRDLKAEAAMALQKAKGYSRERPGFRLNLRHPGPWR